MFKYFPFLLGAALLFVVLAMIVRLYRWNRIHCPPLLFLPILGRPSSNGSPYPPMPVKDRINGGLTIPIGNRLTVPSLANKNEFTLSFWMLSENQYDGQGTFTTILSRGNGFSIRYNAFQNVLSLSISTLLQPMMPTSSNVQTFQVTPLPLQTWFMVTIVLANRNLDCYLNGTLANSFFLLNVPNLPSAEVWKLFNDPIVFYGMISAIRYFDYAMDKVTARKLYLRQRPPSRGSSPSLSMNWWWTWSNPMFLSRLFQSLSRKAT